MTGSAIPASHELGDFLPQLQLGKRKAIEMAAITFYMFTKNVNQMIIPLDGRHAIFGRCNYFTMSGSFHVKSFAQIMDVVQE